MKLIDTNALLVLIVGSINPNLVNEHKRTSIYDEEDFYQLLYFIGNINTLCILPNVWTEVDNLLNNFNGRFKEAYIFSI